MKAPSQASSKRTILICLRKNAVSDGVHRKLEHDFEVIRCERPDEAIAIFNEKLSALSAAIIDVSIASMDDCALLKAVDAERIFDTIPIIVSTESAPGPMCVQCLEEGAIDVLELPCAEEVLVRRVENAIQLRLGTTFHDIEGMLHVLPSMIFLKDADGRYVFSTQYWHHLDTGGDPKWTIRGKTDVDIRKDKENARAAMEADKEIIRTGKGTSYVIEINADGVQDFIQLIKEPLFDDDGNVTGIIALGNNVTESELLKRDLARRALLDELTGLGNRRAFNEFVEGIPDREDFPIAVISADCDCLKIVNDSLGHLMGDEYIRMAALVLQDGVPDEGVVFRTGGDEFTAFVPNTTTEQAQQLIAGMRHKATLFKLHTDGAIVSYGAACLNSSEDSVSAAIDAADQQMYREKAAHKLAQHRVFHMR